MAIYLTELDDTFNFPSPYKALSDPNGLLAFGGDLDPIESSMVTIKAFSLGMVLENLFYGGALPHALFLTP